LALRYLPLGARSRTVGDFFVVCEFTGKAAVNVQEPGAM
jgi:hypothetical protein